MKTQNFNSAVLKLIQFGAGLWLAFFLMGCNTQISDYVEEAKRTPTTEDPTTPTTPQPIVEGAIAYKITPGKLNSSTNNNAAIKGLASPSAQTLSVGPDMSMTVKFSGSVTTR